jgi:hypothetical protein
MAIRGDSYGSVGEVLAFTRHLLGGQASFNSTTRPTLTEVEAFIDRASGQLNLALAGAGFAVPVSNSTAKLSIADWVVERAAEQVEMTQPGTGYSAEEGSRVAAFRRLNRRATEFVQQNSLAFKRLGLTVDHGRAEGLAFTGQGIAGDRVDPDDTALEQPKFKRSQFDNP